MALKDSFINLNKALRTTLQNVPAVVDTLERGFSEIGESVSAGADVKKATNSFNTINGGLLSECKAQFAPVQAGSGDPSPDNVRAITGHTQIEVNVSDDQSTQEQITVNLGGTYYRGTLDIVSGELVVDMAGIDMTSITDWNIDATNKRIYKVCSAMKPNTATGNVPNLICNRFKTVSPAGIYSEVQGVSLSTGSALQFHIDGLTDVETTLEEVNQWFVDNPTFVVYELANPQTIQLSPVIVKALVGDNNLTSPLDGQEITEVEYKEMFTFSDVEKAIDNAIASVYPEAPAADGSYVLTLVKDGTSITRSWVSTEP